MGAVIALEIGYNATQLTEGYDIAGDQCNSAIFFPAMYCKCARIAEAADLTLLAAHTVLMAGQAEPAGSRESEG
ncbi:MAG: hypothetical protein DMG57_32545 [Acidobacteria bacterium]|nr:MAG: hypothetical protein DMG57_32545 [Acidobacteriota bacterium]